MFVHTVALYTHTCHTHTHTHACTRTHTHTCTHIHTHTSTTVYTHIHIHTYMYTVMDLAGFNSNKEWIMTHVTVTAQATVSLNSKLNPLAQPKL